MAVVIYKVYACSIRAISKQIFLVSILVILSFFIKIKFINIFQTVAYLFVINTFFSYESFMKLPGESCCITVPRENNVLILSVYGNLYGTCFVCCK